MTLKNNGCLWFMVLTPLSTIIQLYLNCHFYWWRKPPTCHKSLKNTDLYHNLPALASCTALDIALLDTVLFLWKISSNSCSLRAGDTASDL